MQVNKNTASKNLLIASPISISKETNAIKPKAIRLKAVGNHFTEIAFKHDSSVKAASLALDKETIETSKENSETIILHRPIAHVVPSSTLLQNLEYENHQQIFLNVHSHAQELNQVNCNQSTLNLHQSPAPLNNTKFLRTSSSNINEYKNHKDRKSSDGYIWRKYGQKLPKGSEFPRAYYRCTHPACPVKKMVDRSKNGEISEIIYRGDHNHPKRSSSRSRGKAFVSDEFINERNIFEFETENYNVDGIDSHIDISPVPVSFSTDSEGVKASEFFTMDDYLSMSQKRKYDDNLRDSSVVAESSPIPKLTASMECINANNDGYNWRKYGHKVVKGKTYPRNYYRCSDQKCRARKYIDRASEDSGIFITTYKGKHEHE